MEVTIENFTFSSNFESGNLARVLSITPPGCSQNPQTGNTIGASNLGRKGPYKPVNIVQQNVEVLPFNFEFNLWTRPDCAGTEFENNNRTWFFFSIKGGVTGDRVRLNVMNLNKQLKLYSQGMQPVVQFVGTTTKNPRWERIKEKCSYRSEENCTVISWIHSVNDAQATVYYAFTYPFTYTELQTMLNGLCKRFPPGCSSLYYHQEILTHSLDGHRLDFITVTSHLGQTEEREDTIPGLFPDKNSERPFRFKGKKIVFVSARVHPGETPSSFVFNGFLNFIVSNDQRAIQLRDSFVFKMIPMLNPDGVIRGHYRTDQRGVNLNRVYINPSLKHHPTIFAARQIILYHHTGSVPNVDIDNSDNGQESSNLNDSISQDSNRHKVQPPELDEDTCHSFSDVGGNKHKLGGISGISSYMELDEPSASGWDISSNISLESNIHHTFSQNLDVHDDCSNLSCMSEGETGVTSMFSSLASVNPSNTEARSFLSQCKLDTLSEKNEPETPVKTVKDAESFGLLPKISCNKCHQKIDELGESFVKCTCDNSGEIKSDFIIDKSSNNDKNSAKRTNYDLNQLNLNKSECIDNKYSNMQFNMQENIQCLNKDSSIPNTSIDNKDIKSPHRKLFPDLPNITASSKDLPLISSSESEAESGKPGREADILEGPLKCRQKIHGCKFASPSPLPIHPTTPNKTSSGLYLYVDLHGHASKRGIFIYGNWYEEAAMMVDNMLFPKLLAINCPNFEFSACNFSERNMYLKDRRDGMSKEGSGRVAVMRATGLLRSYTLECNYNTGRTYNPTPPTPLDRKSLGNPNGLPPKYNPAIFEDCGKQLAISLLDEIGENTATRVSQTQYGNLVGVKAWLNHFLTSSSLSPRTQNSVGINIHTPRSQSNKLATRTQSSKSPNKFSIERFAVGNKSPTNTSRLNIPKRNSPGTPTSPRSARMRSQRVRRHSWCMTVDAENQEPQQTGDSARHTNKISKSGGYSSRSKKGSKLKIPSPKKSNVARSLTFTELGEGSHLSSGEMKLPVGKINSNKHSLTASVSLTPNLNVKLSISESPESPTLVKKVEKIRRQRKAVSSGSKKLKISPGCSSSHDESPLKSKDSFYGLPTIENEYKCSPLSPSHEGFYPNAQSPLSPRSPLSSVCEPQASHSSPGLNVITTTASCDIHIQPKSPVIVSPKKVFHSPNKRSSKHSLKSLSKSMDRLPAVAGATGERLKLLPKKGKKKNARSVSDLSSSISKQTGSQPTLDWIIGEPHKMLAGDLDIVAPKVKKRKKSNRKSL